MSKYSRTHLSDAALLRDLEQHVACERGDAAEVLADLAEVDARKLYLPAAYPSMYSWCVDELGLSEDAAKKRIHAARAARRFPAIFVAVAEGRLHLSAVVLLAPHLTPENADELLAGAAHKSKAEVERLLAQRFPRTDIPALVQPIAGDPGDQRAPGHVEGGSAPALEMSGERAPGRVEYPKITPLAPDRYALQCTMSQSTYETLQYALALLGHQIAPKDLPTVLDRALKALVEQLEKSKFAKTSRPRPRSRRGATPRHIPAEVKRHVWERDHGQCTFVSEKGRRCSATSRLEFDHADPVARGGQASRDKIRLRCRAHNQYGAECVYGVAFMNHKRNEVQRIAADRRRSEPVAEPRAAKPVPEPDPERDVTPWLRSLGFRADEARRAAAHCESIPDASLEARVRRAPSYLAPPCRRIAATGAGAT